MDATRSAKDVIIMDICLTGVLSVITFLTSARWLKKTDLVDGFFPEYIEDYYDYSRYLNGEYVADLDDHENSKMLSKSMRRYLKIDN